MYKSFFEMDRTPFLQSLPVSELYADTDTTEIYNRLIYMAQRQFFAVLVGDTGMGNTTTPKKFKETLDGTEYAVLYSATNFPGARNTQHRLFRQRSSTAT